MACRGMRKIFTFQILKVLLCYVSRMSECRRYWSVWRRKWVIRNLPHVFRTPSIHLGVSFCASASFQTFPSLEASSRARLAQCVLKYHWYIFDSCPQNNFEGLVQNGPYTSANQMMWSFCRPQDSLTHCSFLTTLMPHCNPRSSQYRLLVLSFALVGNKPQYSISIQYMSFFTFVGLNFQETVSIKQAQAVWEASRNIKSPICVTASPQRIEGIKPINILCKMCDQKERRARKLWGAASGQPSRYRNEIAW